MTNPLTQGLILLAIVAALWFLCGPVLRHFSKPKAPPSLDTLMAADEDRAIREAYRLRRELEQTMAALGLQEQRIEAIQDERAEQADRGERINIADHVHVDVKTFRTPSEVEQFFARERATLVEAQAPAMTRAPV